jgi:hypothetical protein
MTTREVFMPKKRSNDGCCLVSLFLWPFRLLESLIDELSGQAITSKPPKARQPSQINARSNIQTAGNRFVEVTPVRNRNPHQPQISVSVSYESSQTIFLKEAQKYRNKEENGATPVPFMHYWPTYRDMDGDQQRWYFFWRAQVRRGNYLSTDLSYIFVHVYELLNLVEFPDATQAANQIKTLWQVYRGTYPQLDRYLPEWGGDLLALKVNGAIALQWWENLANVDGITIPDPVVNTIVEKAIRSSGAADLPYKIWFLLSDYQPKNKFYQLHNTNHQIDLAYEKAIRVANQYYLRTSKKSLLDKFVSERVVTYEKNVFTSALIGYPYPRVIHLTSGRNYAGSARLANSITSIMKYAENLLRKQFRFSAKLSGVELPVKLAKELDIALAPPVPEPEPIRITLDPNRVAALHQESQAVSEMLATETADQEKVLLTDLAEVRTLWVELNGLEKQLVAGIFKGDFPSRAHVEKFLEQREVKNDGIIESINNKSLPILGDRLVYLSNPGLLLAEDFIDELEVVIREHPPEIDATETGGNGASDSWVLLFDQLEPPEIEILKLLSKKGSLTEAEAESIARAYNLMGNAVMDSLNEKALSRLDHLPIYLDGDQWLMEEDDLPNLQKHFGIEVN